MIMNMMRDCMEKFNTELLKSYNLCLEELITTVQKETGFTREASIEYINKYMDLTFELRSENDNRMFLDLIPKWKPVEEILKEGLE